MEGRLLEAGLSGIGSNGLSSAAADSVILASDSMSVLEIVIGSSVSMAAEGAAAADLEAKSGRSSSTGSGSMSCSSGL